jgi:hypothetical protein
MPYQATVLRVMIASPGDVDEERNAIRRVVHDWNDVNSSSTKIVLLAVGWESNAYPDLAGRPQQLINDRLLADCDLLIGVFWTRLGSSTGKAISGTVEEITEHTAAGKPTMLYFSSKPVAPESLDPEQFAMLTKFKADCKPLGLVEPYDSLEEFERKVSKHLQMAILQNEAIKRLVTATVRVASGSKERGARERNSSDSVIWLSVEAQRLLKAAAQPKMGFIAKVSSLSGVVIMAGGESFGGEGPKESALWQEALNELVREKLVEPKGYKGEMFALTHLGWTSSDSLK